jgi:hypothetical protein
LPNLVVLPRAALRGERQVLVVDHQSRLRFRDVEVLRRVNEEVFISGGLRRGELVCVSPLQSTADGMLVRLADEPSAALAGTPGGDHGS